VLLEPQVLPPAKDDKDNFFVQVTYKKKTEKENKDLLLASKEVLPEKKELSLQK